MAILWLLLRKTTLRHWRFSFRQNTILLLVLSLGIGVYFSISLANKAALASFESFTNTLVGKSDWIIQPQTGYFKEAILSDIKKLVGARSVNIVPVVETSAAESDDSYNSGLSRNTYTLIGIDIVAVSNLPSKSKDTSLYINQSEQFWSEFRSGPKIWIPRSLGSKKSLNLIITDKIVSLPIAGIIPTQPEAPKIPDSVIIMDLPDLQKLCAKEGYLNRIEFIVNPGVDYEKRRIELGNLLQQQGDLSHKWIVRTEGANRTSAKIMTRAFSYNLNILSLIALLVGLYLVFQAMDGAVVRRRLEIAILRSLGISPFQIRVLWLMEACLFGFIGGICGLVLGYFGSQQAVRIVGRTINALYFSTTINAAHFEKNEALIALLLSIVACLLSGWWPAKQAAEIAPAQLLVRTGSTHEGATLWKKPTLGIILVILGFILINFNPIHEAGGVRLPLAGYFACLAWIVGSGMLCATTLPLLGLLYKKIGNTYVSFRIAGGYLIKASSRHRLAAAALVCAIGMSAGMAILVGSFEKTIQSWVKQVLQADLYIYSSGSRSVTEASRISEITWKAIAKHEGVENAWILTTYPFQMGEGQSVLLTGNNLALIKQYEILKWVESPKDDSLFNFSTNDNLAAISESLSERYQLHRGMELSLPIEGKIHKLIIAGVFADYGNERGSIIIERDHLVDWSRDNTATHISLLVKPGVNANTLKSVLSKEYPGLNILSQTNLKNEILTIFHQTFYITYALQLIGIMVALTGIALTMMSIIVDRFDQLTILRAIGFTHNEISFATAIEGLALALWSTFWGLILSLGLGWILIYVINKQAFGWTLGPRIPVYNFLMLGLFVGLSGLILSYCVAYLGSKLPVDTNNEN